ncbi:hypothetical protein B0H13DRAFT_2574043 [Mycena leptocephala]|nr:hypothetical protein B0H13DRAFT_2574043 [Mycena leptocephala]
MSKLSITTSSSTPSFASPSLYAGDTPHIPSVIIASPTLVNEENLIELNKVQFQNTKVVYHSEVWSGHHLPKEMKYENIDSMEVFSLLLAPLARTIHVTRPDGTSGLEYEVVLPPHNSYRAQLKTLTGVDPDFSVNPHRVTHHDFDSADVWASVFIKSPEHLLFHLNRPQNHRCLQHGSTLKAPSAWSGTAVVTEKLVESAGWTILELRLRTSNHPIYLRTVDSSKDTPMAGEELLKEGIYHRLLAAADKPPSLSPMGVSGRSVVDASSSTPSQMNKLLSVLCLDRRSFS